MDWRWHITVWGVRGSASRPSPDCMEYGGNTVCTTLEYKGHVIVLDAGTGLASLGRSLDARKDIRRLDILLGHFHMDHLLGLCSFTPLFDPDMEINLYGGAGLEQSLETLIGPPFWPLGIREFPTRLAFHEIQPGESFGLGSLTVSTMTGSHPGESILYRLDGGGKSLTYALDCEADGSIFPALAGFAHRTNLLIWDANFTQSDIRHGWGHSTWEQGLELGRVAEVGQVLMTHYNWGYTDGFLHRQEEQARQDGRCLFAREGMVITL